MRDLYLLAIMSEPWAILPAKLEAIAAVIERHAAGIRLTAEDLERYEAKTPAQSRQSGAVAIVPVHGVLSQRVNLLSAMSGGVSTEMIGKQIDALAGDPAIAAIVLDVDSPGGSVYGIDELTTKVAAASTRKPVVAVANSLMASAAYYLSSAASEIVVTPGGEAGSIGVLAAHKDYSEADAKAGVRTTWIHAGRYKTEGNDTEPLGDEARAAIQGRVDEYYQMFVRAVARGRGVAVKDVTNGFGEGRVVGARDAVRMGMADRVETLDQAVARVARNPAAVGRLTAEAETVDLVATLPVTDDAPPAIRSPVSDEQTAERYRPARAGLYKRELQRRAEDRRSAEVGGAG